MNAKADNSGSTSTRIGESAKLLVGNNLDIRSDASGESAVDVISPTVSGAIIQDNNVSAVASFDTEARLGAAGVAVVGGNTTIELVRPKCSDRCCIDWRVRVDGGDFQCAIHSRW